MTDSRAPIKVTHAEYLKDFKITLSFSDGLTGVVDLENELWGEVFTPFKDIHYFKNFSQDRWTIYWDCGADFAPAIFARTGIKTK